MKMRGYRYILGLAIVACLGLTAYAATAQRKPKHDSFDSRGRSLERGYELYDAGEYRAAKRELARAFDEMLMKTAVYSLNDRVKLEFHIADCASRLGEHNAYDLMNEFVSRYPDSQYAGEMRFSIANYLFDKKDYGSALEVYRSIENDKRSEVQIQEYRFKRGYSHFARVEYREAQRYLRRVEGAEYSSHAHYYLAYMEYISGNYDVAKEGFMELRDHEVYAPVVPFYLLQIEFLFNNYEYVINNGDALLKQSAEGERAADIARVMSESWFRFGDYEKAVSYMALFEENGGVMGREEYYLRGYAQYVRNEVDGAIESLSRVAGADDKLTQNAAYHLGGCYLRKGDKRKAMHSFSMAASATYDPQVREEAMFNYGKLQYELGEGVFNEAINILTRYIEEYPGSKRVGEAQQYLVSAYYNSKNYDAAYEAIKLMPNPDNNIRMAFQKIAYFRALEYYNEGHLGVAYRVLEESLKNRYNPKYTALTQFWMGEIEFKQGRYDKAAELYKRYIALAPAHETEHKMALYNLGYCYFNSGKWSESQEWFERFRKAYAAQDEYVADSYNRTGDIYFAERKFWKAIEEYDAAMKYGTRQGHYAKFQRAMMLGYVDRDQRKVETLQEIIAANSGEYVESAMYELATTYTSMSNFKEANTAMQAFVKRYPNSNKHLAALADMGLIHQNLGDDKRALEYYKKVVSEAPASTEARSAMIAIKGIYVDRNDVDSYFDFAAASGIETDLGATARDSLAYVSAERTYMTSDDAPRKEKVLEEYLEKYPQGAYRANALNYLAEAYAQAGQNRKAVAVLQQLVEMKSNRFMESGLERLGALCEGEKMFMEAAEAYGELGEVVVERDVAERALDRYLKNAVAHGDTKFVERVTEELSVHPKASKETRREAMFVRAEILERKGDNKAAMELYWTLVDEAKTRVGAQSTLKVIENLYAEGKYDQVEKMVMDFAAQKSSHRYQLGRAFLVLGDVYAKRGDKFQARATYQSIVDGYSPQDDGVVDEAKKRIESLK